MPDIKPYTARRAALLRSMGDGVAIIPTAPERIRNRDAHTYVPGVRGDDFAHVDGLFLRPLNQLVIWSGLTFEGHDDCPEG